MSLEPAIAIWFLFFVAVAFVSLSFGVRTSEEVGAASVPGQAESAPHRFNLKRHLLRAAVITTVVFVIYDLNWVYGWIGLDSFDVYHRIFGDAV